MHKEEPIKDDRKETGTFLDSIYTNKPGICSERMAFVLCCIACLFYMAFRSILNIHDGRKLLDFIAKAGLRHIVAKTGYQFWDICRVDVIAHTILVASESF